MLILELSGTSAATLDDATGRVLRGLPVGEYADAGVRVIAREAGRQRRKVVIDQPSEKVAPALARISLPESVQITARFTDEPRGVK